MRRGGALERLLRDGKGRPAVPSHDDYAGHRAGSGLDHARGNRRSSTVSVVKDVEPGGSYPQPYQSGERDVIGAITRAGDAGVRAALFQAATVMLNRGAKSWLTAWAQKVAGRRGRKRATEALARRIGVILHRMWSDGTEFRFTRTVDVNTAVA